MHQRIKNYNNYICCPYVDLGQGIDVIPSNMVQGTTIEWNKPWVIPFNHFLVKHS